MKMHLLPAAKFSAVNSLKEVTNPIIFERGNQPTADGLLSTEIFGSSMKDRMETFAYIDLKGNYLSPLVYKNLMRLDKRFKNLIDGSATYLISPEGELIEDPDGGSGINFLYKNYDKIVFKRNASRMRSERIELMENNRKSDIFISVLPVLPAYYRDTNLNTGTDGRITHHEINDLYSRLIRLVNITNSGDNFSLNLKLTQDRIQTTIVEIYDSFKARIEKKNGMTRSSLMGKNLDYGIRTIITAPNFDANTPEEMTVTLDKSGLPLYQAVSSFYPFFVNWISNFFRREFTLSGKYYPIIDKEGKVIDRVEIEDPEMHFDNEYIEKAMKRFINAPTSRFDKIKIPIKEGKYKDKVSMRMKGRYSESGKPEDMSPLVNRPLTWTDIMYQAAVDICKDKVIWVTRYPLLDYFGKFPSHIHVLSTAQTVPMFVGDNFYPHYPKVELGTPPDEIMTLFSDTLEISNMYLLGTGGDYDGDQVTVKGSFTQEAIQEAERIMNSPVSVINIFGGNMRTTTNEGIQTAYMMTRKVKKG